jgi:hypothetical protein
LFDDVLGAKPPVVFEGAASVDDIGAIEGEARVAGLRHGFDDGGEIVAGGEAVADEEDIECPGFVRGPCGHGK